MNAAHDALRRLREMLGDPLLVRGRAGMMLTPRAEALAETGELDVAVVPRIDDAATDGPSHGLVRRTIFRDDFVGLIRAETPRYAAAS